MKPVDPPQPSRQGGSTRPTQAKGKGTAQAIEEELIEQEQEGHVEQLDELLHRLNRADVDPSLANFLEGDGITQVVVGQLLDTIDNLQDELEKAKWAQQDVETRLIRATHKHPASPHCDNIDNASHQWKRKCGTDNGGVLTTQPPEVPEHSQETHPHPQRAQDPLGPTAKPASHVEITPKEDKATEPPPPKALMKKLRRGEGQTLVPTTYVMPTSLPHAPTPPIDTSPEQPMLSETIKGLSNDDKWKQDLWEPIEGETKQQVQQQLAHNCKLKNEHEKKMKNSGKNIKEEICQR